MAYEWNDNIMYLSGTMTTITSVHSRRFLTGSPRKNLAFRLQDCMIATSPRKSHTGIRR